MRVSDIFFRNGRKGYLWVYLILSIAGCWVSASQDLPIWATLLAGFCIVGPFITLGLVLAWKSTYATNHVPEQKTSFMERWNNRINKVFIWLFD